MWIYPKKSTNALDFKYETKIIESLIPKIRFQISAGFLSIFLYSLFCFFSTYRLFTNKESNYKQTFLIILWTIYFSIYNVASFVIASMTTWSGKYTSILIHKAINFCNCEELIDTVGGTLKLNGKFGDFDVILIPISFSGAFSHCKPKGDRLKLQQAYLTSIGKHF